MGRRAHIVWHLTAATHDIQIECIEQLLVFLLLKLFDEVCDCVKYILRVFPRAGHCWFETKVSMHLHNSSLSGTVGPCLTSLPSEEIVCMFRY